MLLLADSTNSEVKSALHLYNVVTQRRDVMMDIKANKLKTILQFSIPSVIAMVLETIITITDGYFTGNYVGEDALAAINLGLPILYFYLGIGLCVGVGGTVICGKMLGAKDSHRASQVFSQTIVTAVIVCAATSLVVLLLFSPILKVLRADGKLSAYFTQYYKIMLFAYPLMVIESIFGMFTRMDGKPQACMLVRVASCILNAVLDYILVGRLALGIQGSAAATLAVQATSVMLQAVYFLKLSSSIQFRRFRFDRAVNMATILNGSSEFIGEMASTISMFTYNYVLMKHVGVQGVAAFTVLGFAVYGYSMVTIGFGQGLTTLVSVSWGAKEWETALELRRTTNRILFGTGALFAVCFWVLGGKYAELFGCSNSVGNMVATGFKFCSITFLIMGYDVTNSMYFTSCGDALSSAIISALRGIVLLLTFLILFPAVWGMTGVWMAAPAAESLTAVVSAFLIRKQKKKLESR